MKKNTQIFRAVLLLITALLVSYTVNSQNTPLGTPATQNPNGTTAIPGTPAACATGFSFYTITHDDENTGAFLPAGIGVTTSLVNSGTTDITIIGTPNGAGIGDVDNIVADGGRINYSSTDGGNLDATYNFDVTVTNPYIFIGDMETFTTINIFDCTGNPINVNLMNGQSRFAASGNSAFITGTTSTNQDGYIQVPGSFDCLVINIDNPAPFTLDVIQVSVGVCSSDTSLMSNIEIDASGNLVYTDSDGVDDDITMVVDGSNYLLSDPNGTLVAGNGTTQDGMDVLVPITSVTGDIIINTLGGDDNLAVDLSGGNFTDIINYDGGNQTIGDILTLYGDGTLNEVTHSFVNENDGSVDITGNSTITYTGLEPIIDNLDVVDRIFNFTGGAETITLDAGGTLDNQIDSTLGESVDFNNPISSLTINAGTGDDTINMEGVDAAFDADLTVNGDADDDTVNFQINPTSVGNGSVTVTSEEIYVSQNLTTPSGASLTGGKTVEVINNAVLSSIDGDITIIGGNATVAGDDFLGMRVDSGVLRTTGSGDISITGIGSFTALDFRHGITLRNAAVVEATGTGSVTLDGTAGDALGAEGMLIFENSRIEANGGGIDLSGQGGNSTLNGNRGINLTNGTVQDLNGGEIDIDGTASGTGSNNSGTFLSGSSITSTTGDITVAGEGSVTGIDNNFGVGFLGASSITSSGGTIAIAGNGNGSGNTNRGIRVVGGSSINNSGFGEIFAIGTSLGGIQNNSGIELDNATITIEDGNIELFGLGFGDGTSTINRGTHMFNSSSVSATGSGSVEIFGVAGDGTDNNQGILISSSSSASTTSGRIELEGFGRGTGNGCHGIFLTNGGSLISTSGDIDLTGEGSQDANGGNASGVLIEDSGTQITTTDGAIDIEGEGGGTTGNAGGSNRGVLIRNQPTIQTLGTGNITIDGEGGESSGSFNRGIDIQSAGTIIRTNGGGITMDGMAGTGDSQAIGVVLLTGPTIQDTNGGTIDITGIGGSGTGNFYAGVTINDTDILASDGDITIEGTGGTGNGNLELGVRVLNNSVVQTTGTGTITINGTGGTGSNDNYGTQFASGSTLTTENGDMSLTGIATDNTGSNHYGLWLTGTFTTTGSGNIILNGTAGRSNTRDISIEDAGTLISAGNGNVSMTGTNGFGIITPGGIPPADIIVANQIIVNGNLRPGNTSGVNVGLLPISGNLQMASDDELIFNIRNFVTAGVHYDQVSVTGTIDITDSNVVFVDNVGPIEDSCETLLLIDNDGTDPMIGTFNGLAEGDSVVFGDITGKISYIGGDGNDFVLILDDTQPTITCPADIVTTTDPGICGAEIFFADAIASDNCGMAVVSQTDGLPSGSTFPVGVSTVEFTAIDVNGNTSVCTFTITVNDIEAPTLTCPADIVVDNDTGVCGAVVNYNIEALDNCGVLANKITTLFSSNNNGSEGGAIYFNVTTQADEIQVGSLESNIIGSAQTVTMDIYVAEGSYDGNETDPSFWGTPVASASGTREPVNNPTTLQLSSVIVLMPNTTYAFALDLTSANIHRYRNGNGSNQSYTDGNLTVDLGSATNTEFTGPVFSPRVWNGSLIYGLNGAPLSLVQTAGLPSGSEFPIGTTTNSFEVTDYAGNMSTCSFEVTVNDTEAPQIASCPADITVNNDTGVCGATVNYETPLALDNCDPTIFAGFTYLGNYDNKAYYVSNNSSDGPDAFIAAEAQNGFVATIVSQDQNDWLRNVLNTEGVGEAIIGFTDRDVEGTFTWHSVSTSSYTNWNTNEPNDAGPGEDYTVMRNDGLWNDVRSSTPRPFVIETTGLPITQTTGLPSGSVFPVGTTTNTFIATDPSGNISTCSFTVTVNDAEAPIAVCQNITIPLDANGNASITAGDVDGGSTDNCGIASLTVSPATFDCSDVGINPVTLTVTDVNGNVSTCTALITVEDNVPPVAVCQNIDVFLDATGSVTITPADVDGGSTDACGIASLAIDIDTFTCDADLGPNDVTLTVTDVNGNVSTCIAVVTVIDDIDPTIACPADIAVNTDADLCSAVVTFPDAIALDNCTVTVAQTGGLPSGSAFPVGVSTVEYTATDSSGNTAVCTFTVTVTDNEPPLAVCQDITVQLDATGTVTITPTDVDGGSSDNCGVASLAIDIDTFTCADVGPNDVTLTVTDVNGNTSTCIAVVTVEDNVPPVAVCMDITVELDVNGTVTITGTDVAGASTDACSIDTIELDIDTFTCDDVGDNTVTVTVTDVNGNVSTCTAIVTVEDNIAPDLVCMDITVELDENGEAVITPEDVMTNNTDACGILTTGIDIFEFSCDDIGTPVTVTVFSQDNNGNLSSCMAVVTVVDALAPVVTCPADPTVDPGVGNLFYEVPDYWASGDATAVDNCTDPVTIFTQDPAPGTELPDGVYTITLTAEDDLGNVGTCTFELTVESILGVGDAGDGNIGTLVLYPNPATNTVFLSNPQTLNLNDMQIFDLTGRLIQTIQLEGMDTEKAIDITHLASATYVVIVTGEDGQIKKQLIKE
ncbi:MAG: HYR domain-containing protein [Bacteroidota bacterium]